MTQLQKLSSLSREEYIHWLDKYGAFDRSPWMKWFDEHYCKNCESLTVIVKDLSGRDKQIRCSFCELYDFCSNFPVLGHTPNNKDIIGLWFDSEVETNETVD